MKSIAYVGDLVITGDNIAAAVVDFATALARRGTSDSISIPALDSSGIVVQVQLLLGPSSQLVVEPVDSPYPDSEDPSVLDDLKKRTAALGPIHAQADDRPIDPDYDFETFADLGE